MPRAKISNNRQHSDPATARHNVVAALFTTLRRAAAGPVCRALHAMRLPNIIIVLSLAFPSLSLAAADLVVVDKSERRMTLFKQDQVLATYVVSLGGSPHGHKTEEGDQKTPEGEYVLDYKNEQSSYYRSMHVNYPNAEDIAQAERRGVSPGGLIMVHGQRNGFGWLSWIMQRFDWTDGCIAITNEEMDEFMSLVAPGTPIHISW